MKSLLVESAPMRKVSAVVDFLCTGGFHPLGIVTDGAITTVRRPCGMDKPAAIAPPLPPAGSPVNFSCKACLASIADSVQAVKPSCVVSMHCATASSTFALTPLSLPPPPPPTPLKFPSHREAQPATPFCVDAMHCEAAASTLAFALCRKPPNPLKPPALESSR